MRQRGLSWESYVQVAGGLLGLTWSLNRLRRAQTDWLTWTVTGIAAPMLLNGITDWLPMRIPGAGRALPALLRSLS